MKKHKKKKGKKAASKKKITIPAPTLIPPWLEDIGYSSPEKAVEPPKSTVAPPSSQQVVGEYTTEELDSLLIQFYHSDMWVAYKAFVDRQVKSAEDVLRSIDLFKEPTTAARNQGVLGAIAELQKYIKSVIEERTRANTPPTI